MPGLDEAPRRKVEAAERGPGDEMQRLLGVHVVLARAAGLLATLRGGGAASPPRAPVSGSERGGLLGRLFGRD